MIQPSHVPILGALLWAVAAQAGCARSELAPAPETSASRGAARHRFVPPFAYEAYVRGELALAAQRPEQAVLQFELASAAPEEDAFLLSRLAEAQAEAGEREAALRTLAEAERVDACQEELWLTRGKWAEAEGNAASAELSYQRALACTPDSERARVALYRVWKKLGREAEALKLLTEPGAAPSGRGRSVLLLHALAHDDVAAVRFALDSWLGAGGLSADALSAAIAEVAARNEPSLALTFKNLGLLAPTVETRARLAVQSFDRALLQSLLSEHSDQALGGPAQAARFALVARDYERAELYASVALSHAPSDALRALKIEALSALGEHEAALSETRALSDPTLQQKVARAQLARLGFPELSKELAQTDPH